MFLLDAEPSFRAWVQSQPRALVAFCATNCPYARAFRPHFERADTGPWAPAVRELDIHSDDEWDHDRIEITPTLVAYEHGREVARLPGRAHRGLTREQLLDWLKRLA